jgi:hypothetical protein
MGGVAAIVLALLAGVPLLRSGQLFRSNETGALVDSADIVGFLATELKPGDALVVNFPANPIIEYELRQKSPALLASLASDQVARRLIVVVPKPEVSSESYPPDVLLAKLETEDVADASGASSRIESKEFTGPELLAKFLSVTVYGFERR